jgi:hypothetical protein
MSDYLDANALAALGPLDSNDIPLRQALAMFIDDDINKAGAIITNYIKDESKKYQKREGRGFILSFALIFIAVISFLSSIADSKVNPVFSNRAIMLTLVLLFFACVPRFRMQSFQYGNVPDAPLDLPHAAYERIDEFLAPLQKEFELKAYYYSVLKKKRIPLERRQFFGKLRYLLFSEHPHIRGLVLRYPTAMASPQGICIRRSDLEKMIAANAPKRKGGPGRTPSPRYADAIIALIGDKKLLRIDTRDAESAVKQIRETLKDWFKTNKDDTEWEPKTNQIETYVEKIYAHLKNLASLR